MTLSFFQAHVKEMREVLEGLTQNMLQSSHYINTLNDKFTSLSRRSTDSSRTDSLGNVSTSSDGQGNKPIYQRYSTHFYALALKDREHIVLPVSVCLSFCLSKT